MNRPEELTYTTIEIRSFLPTGWSLPTSEGEGCWDAQRGTWSVTLIAGSDLERPVEVDLSKVEALGRMEALRQAMRKTYQQVLP
jgi:hypothetical protein